MAAGSVRLAEMKSAELILSCAAATHSFKFLSEDDMQVQHSYKLE